MGKTDSVKVDMNRRYAFWNSIEIWARNKVKESHKGRKRQKGRESKNNVIALNLSLLKTIS